MLDFPSSPTPGVTTFAQGLKTWKCIAVDAGGKFIWDVISTPEALSQAALDSAAAATASAAAAASSVVAAQAEKSSAEAAKVQAETARDSAFTISGLYPDTATALADVSLVVGKYFGVLSAASSEVALVYRKVAGPAATDTGKRVPSTGLLLYPRPLSETVGTGITGTGAEVSATYIQTWPTANAYEAFVNSIQFQVSAAGWVRIYVYTLVSGSNYTVSKIIDFRVAAGVNTFTAPVDFDHFRLPIGSRIGGKIVNGSTNIQCQLAPTASGSARNFLASESTVVGAVAVLRAVDDINDNRIPSIKYTTVHPDTLLTQSTTQLVEIGAGRVVTKKELAATRRGKTSLNRQFFPGTTTPTNWTLAGWTVNNGLVAPAVAGAATHACWSIYDNHNYGVIRARFLVTDATTSRFGIRVNPTQGAWGGAVQIDAATSKMIVYTVSAVPAFTSLEPTYGKFIAVPALVPGREYLMTLRKLGLETEIEWRDCTTGAVTSMTSYPTDETHDSYLGRAGVVYTAGAANGVTVKYFETAAAFENPKIVLLGDSNLWGGSDSQSSRKMDDWKKAWAYLLDAQRGRGDVVNAGRGGETASTIATSLLANHVTQWNPDHFVIAIGSNDTVQATWRTNVATILAACVARSPNPPTICTIPPSGTNQAVKTLMNADIRAKFFGDYPVIDFATALSVGHDGVTIDTTLFNTDQIHANSLGQALLFEQLKSDAPFLLRD